MLEDVDFNWWAILVSAAVPMALGMFWYGPYLFAERWLRAIGKTREEISGPGAGYVVVLMGAFAMAYVLARVVDWADATSFGDGLLVGTLAWFGFVATTMAVNGIFAGRSWTLFAIDAGYHLASLLAMGVILALWD